LRLFKTHWWDIREKVPKELESRYRGDEANSCREL